MIRAIIFDCFGVLYHSSADELYRRCPLEQRDELHDIRMQRDRGHLHYDEYIELVAELLHMDNAELRRLADQSHVRNEGLFEYIRSIDRTEYLTGLLSNIGDTTMDQLIPPSERQALFSQALLSYEVGIIKPDPRVFTMMVERLGCLPEECVMIDDIERNCAGARSIGMQAIQHGDNDETLRALAKLLEAADA
jgi:FMN phosphatase YigB (HAD superfamily)